MKVLFNRTRFADAARIAFGFIDQFTAQQQRDLIMTFTNALVAVVVVLTTFGRLPDVLASPPSYKRLHLDAQNEGSVDCDKLMGKRHVATAPNLDPGSRGVPRGGPRGGPRGSRPGPKDLEASILFAKDTVSRMSRLEANLAGAGVTVRPGTPSHSQLIDSYPEPRALAAGMDALVALKASLYLAHSHCARFGLKEDRCAKYISTFNLNTTSFGNKCSSESSSQFCDKSSKYRSLDGSCNHRESASAGAAFSGYSRLLGPEYGDSMQKPRENFRGRPLPSARLISTRLAGAKLTGGAKNPGDDKTLALAQWTQFIEHDMAHTATSKMSNTRQSIECCSPDGGVLKPRHVHPSCLPIDVPHDDPELARERVRCANYVRSVPAMRGDCSFGPLEQMNQASHYLDGSMIYGTTSEKALSLRQRTQGKLIDSSKGGRRFLPNVEKPTEECLVNSDATTCYKSGDVRVNAHPHLTAMYTVWHREHNRVATALAGLNPSWDDEALYQEARRVVSAQIQHITFNEWIPAVLGEKFSKKQGLKLPKEGFTTRYNETIDPSVSNSFSAGALRFGHVVSMTSPASASASASDLSSHLRSKTLSEPEDIAVLGVDGLIRGLVAQKAPEASENVTADDVARSLLKDSYPFGLDTLSLDIQRGRDHGLPGYNSYRKICGLPVATNFDQFQDVIPKSVVTSLKSVYSHPQDVDLVAGGSAERPSPGSLLGPTFRCILAEQFARTFRGDRFFYDLQNQPHSFTPEQLRSLKKVTLARIFCDNGDNIESMQPDVFRQPKPASNELARCNDDARIPRLDLDLWKTADQQSVT